MLIQSFICILLIGTGTPVAGGLATWQALEIIRGLEGLNLVGMDLVEVSPPFDHAEITAIAAARSVNFC